MEAPARPGPVTRVSVRVHDGASSRSRNDIVATEEPLEIRVSIAGQSRTVAVTMRTPGSDFELAVGFLFGEGVIRRREQVVSISYCKDDDLPPDQLYNIVIVELDGSSEIDLKPLDRHFYTSSACGVCGKANLESIAMRGVTKVAAGPTVLARTIRTLPETLRRGQAVFDETGGLHAAGLFDAAGSLIATREDVGRHNALDKLIGWAFLEAMPPLNDHIVMVSGRSSFELAQKCVTAGVPMLCSVSAPSSLAIDVASGFGMTLIGFLRGDRMNVYAGEQRVSG